MARVMVEPVRAMARATAQVRALAQTFELFLR
jgi:hypothetical protein